MAIVTRRYQLVGPTNADLTKYVGLSAVRNAVFGGAVIDIDIDNVVGGFAETLNERMAELGFQFDAAATPPSLLGSVGAFTKQQFTVPSALVYGANIAVDASLSNLYTVTLTGVTAQLDNPTSLIAGETLTFLVTQDATGGRGLTFGTNYFFGSAGVPILTTSLANEIDVISAIAVSPTKLVCTTNRRF